MQSTPKGSARRWFAPTCALCRLSRSGPVAKFFRVRFVRKLRSTEPVSAQLWIEIRASGSPIHNQELGRPAFSRRSRTGRKSLRQAPYGNGYRLALCAIADQSSSNKADPEVG